MSETFVPLGNPRLFSRKGLSMPPPHSDPGFQRTAAPSHTFPVCQKNPVEMWHALILKMSLTAD